jgi:3-oxoacyl-[acyl-carrier-protein] synthase II
MFAGGADAPVTAPVIKVWEAMRVLANPDDPATACRPFSANRLGIVIGEGAGVMVLEDWDRAVARGARILAELAGYGATSDAAHITQPGIDAPVRAIRTALEQARLTPDAVQYVNAHGTGTPLNDSTETAIIKQAFGATRRGSRSARPIDAGHVMGASARSGSSPRSSRCGETAPPTINYTRARSGMRSRHVPNCARSLVIDAPSRTHSPSAAERHPRRPPGARSLTVRARNGSRSSIFPTSSSSRS